MALTGYYYLTLPPATFSYTGNPSLASYPGIPTNYKISPELLRAEHSIAVSVRCAYGSEF